MSDSLTIKKLKKATGIDFVSDTISSYYGNGTSYRTLQKEVESKTHREMRSHAIAHFEKLEYEIYREGIGVRGIFTLADFLAYKNGRIVFVECLTDAKANQEDIKTKKQLSQFGEVCFVIVGGHGCEWENEKHQIPDVFKKLSEETDVLLFQYGHRQNRFQKSISYLTKFPRTSFAIQRGQDVEICLSIQTKQKTATIWFDFQIKPYLVADEMDFLTEIASSIAWQIYRWKKFQTTSLFRMRSAAGKIFKDTSNLLVAQICIRDKRGLLKIRGRHGFDVFEVLLKTLRDAGLSVKFDEQDFIFLRQTMTGTKQINVD